jgi:hypothetical protein
MMTYAQDGERVTLEMTLDDYERLLLMLGYATGAMQDRITFWHWIAFVNELNRTNPQFETYEIPKEYQV